VDGLIEGTQIQTPNQCPNGSREWLSLMRFYIHGPPTYLLLADRIFLAHAASLRQASFFARWKFRGFLHSFIHIDAYRVSQPLVPLA
jgi:hypothetical protein